MKLPPAQLLALLLAFLPASMARAIGQPQPAGSPGVSQVPDALQGIGVDEKPGVKLNLDLMFEDETGKAVRLGDYFDGKRPVILQLGYMKCPMLCTLVSQGIVESLRDLKLRMGDEFEVLSLSFNPEETSKLAALKKETSIKEYGRPDDAGGWHFLTGKAPAINELTASLGYRYKYDVQSQQYSHPAVIMILTPDGRVSRYLYGIKFEPRTLRLSLVEASDGKIGSTVDKFILTCFHWDAKAGKYAIAAMNVMRMAGVLTVALIGAMLWRLYRRDRRLAARVSTAS